MPSIVLAPIKITNVSEDGVVIFGDTLQISPKSTSKAFAGSGGGNTGDFLQSNTLLSFTNTFDPDVLDTNNSSLN